MVLLRATLNIQGDPSRNNRSEPSLHSSTPEASKGPEMRDGYRNGMILAAMCLATFIAILDTSLVNLGLHRIQADLHSSMSTLQWVIDLYNLAYAVLILTGGTLGDLFGWRRIFVIAVLTFAAGSPICAVKPDAAVLIAGRGIAGVGAALELPAALAILNVTYPDAQRRAWAIALWGGMNGLAMAIGPTAGGLLVDSFGWRSRQPNVAVETRLPYYPDLG
jgi:MFS family permease